jgi:hypothetical protein
LEAYTWKIIPGPPSTKYSRAHFVDQKSTLGKFNAGETKAKFAVKLFDEYRNLITPNVFENQLGGNYKDTV